MRIFVAGATGTLGIPLVREMAACGHEVTGLTRSKEKSQMLADLGARATVADALDGTALMAAVGKVRPDLVIHLLTALPKKGPTKASDMAATARLRFTGTDNLLRASIAAGVKRIVGESMIFVYGSGDHGPGKKSEKDPLRTSEPYAAMQEAGDALRYLEQTLITASRRRLIEAVVLRFGLLYGPQVPAMEAALQMVRERKMPVLSSGDRSKPWIHIDDAVSAILAAATRGRSGEIYNIVDDVPSSYRDFMLFAAKLLGAPRPRSIPLWVLRLASPYRAVALSTNLSALNEKAKKELGWRLQFPNYRVGLQALATEMVMPEAA